MLRTRLSKTMQLTKISSSKYSCRRICTYLNNLALNWHVCINVSRHGTCFWPVDHVQGKWEQRIEKGMAKKRWLKEFEDLLVWSFLKTAMHFLCFLSRCFSLSCTHWAHHELHGVLAVSLLHSCLCHFHVSLLGLSSSLSSQLLSYHYPLRAKPVMYADDILLYWPI